jgi:hypothetical protein
MPAPVEHTKPENDTGSLSEPVPRSLSQLLDHFVETTEGQKKVAVADLLDSLDSRSYGPMLMVPALIAISPVGMIPGMSLATGSLIILIATQMMLFSRRPWLPRRLASAEFPRERLQAGVTKVQRWTRPVEKLIQPRLEFLVGRVMIYPIATICILLALSFYPLALIPFAVLVPASAVAFFALGLTTRDGLLVLTGFVLAAISVGGLWYSFT